MKKNQEDNQNMYESTSAVLHNHESIWTANVPFGDNVDVLDGNIDKINDLSDQQDDDSKGATEDKEENRIALEKQTFAVASILAFYAANTNNRTLFEKVNLKQRDLDRARDNELPTIAEGVIGHATDSLLAATPYGLTLLMISDLTGKRTTYVGSITDPREIIVETSSATKQLPAVFKETTTLLDEKLDNGMELYRYSQPDFYQQYKNARIIVNSPTNKRALEMKFTNEATGTVIARVRVSIDGGAVSRRSSSLGNIHVQNLTEGAHTYTAKLPGYENASGNFNVISGETTKLEVKLTGITETA